MAAFGLHRNRPDESNFTSVEPSGFGTRMGGKLDLNFAVHGPIGPDDVKVDKRGLAASVLINEIGGRLGNLSVG